MIFKYLSLLSLFFISTIYAEEDFTNLLNTYESESELSKITKQDSAGFIDIYTRDELEKMQAHNLLDVLKTIPSLYLTRGSNGLTMLSKPTVAKMPSTTIRLYINDHDMSSSSFGSAFMVWGEMPIEYIDHIEVYKASSSIEFGNETASLVIRLYTKTAEREEGSKVRIMADNMGSYDLNAYTASSLENGLSYFVYANNDNVKRESYHKEYQGTEYDYNSDKKGINLYANLTYNKWILELGNYTKKSDSFVGIGVNRTPTDGDLKARQSYIHLSRTFDGGIKLQLSYDDVNYHRTYEDPNGIRISNVSELIENYDIKFHDKIFSAVLEKKLNFNSNKLLLGAFYKSKGFQEDGEFKNSSIENSYNFQNSYSNTLNLYSIYAEDSYDFDSTTRFTASLKGDFFRYTKEVKSQDEFAFRVGAIKNIDKFQFKAFFTKSYIPLAFYQIYNPDNIPYKANPYLEHQDIYIASISARYKDEHNDIELIFVKNQIDNILVYDPTSQYGFYNKKESVNFELYQLKYSYIFNHDNKIMLDIYTGDGDKKVKASPQSGANLRLFNVYNDFDFYNELIMRSDYEYLGIKVNASYDFSLAVKYHVTPDLSLGLRGENIFNSTFKQVYRGVSYAIPVVDRKVWANLEYTF
jgi:iron complex outermembrane receptor protein